MSKKNENKWTQVGNFLLGVEKSSVGNRFVARTVSGDWRIAWLEGTMMYAVMLSFISDEKCHKYLDALLVLQYAATNYPHDLVAIAETQKTPFMDGFTKLIREQTDYEVSVKGNGTDEENEAALHDIGEMQEIQDELEKLDEEEGNG